MVRELPKEHKDFIDKRLKNYGLVSFREFNNAFGENMLTRFAVIVRGGSPSKRYVNELLETGNYVSMPIRSGRSGVGSTKHVIHIVETGLVPFVKEASIGFGGRGVTEFSPVVTALRSVKRQTSRGKTTLILDSGMIGVKKLQSTGVIERIPFKFGEKPKGVSPSIAKFRLTDRKFARRVIAAVERAIKLQQTHHRP